MSPRERLRTKASDMRQNEPTNAEEKHTSPQAARVDGEFGSKATIGDDGELASPVGGEVQEEDGELLEENTRTRKAAAPAASEQRAASGRQCNKSVCDKAQGCTCCCCIRWRRFVVDSRQLEKARAREREQRREAFELISVNQGLEHGGQEDNLMLEKKPPGEQEVHSEDEQQEHKQDGHEREGRHEGSRVAAVRERQSNSNESENGERQCNQEGDKKNESEQDKTKIDTNSLVKLTEEASERQEEPLAVAPRRHLPQYLFNGTTFYSQPVAAPAAAHFVQLQHVFAGAPAMLLGQHYQHYEPLAAAAAFHQAYYLQPAAYVEQRPPPPPPSDAYLQYYAAPAAYGALQVAPALRSQAAANVYLPQLAARHQQQACAPWLPGQPNASLATPNYANYNPFSFLPACPSLLYHQQQQHQHQLASLVQAPPIAEQRLACEQVRPVADVVGAQLKPGHRRAALVALLPIEAQPARTRQAYGMDKVWLDEFEQLFAQFAATSRVAWHLVQVETNPDIRRQCERLVAYEGRFVVRLPPKSAASGGLLGAQSDATSGQGASPRSSSASSSSLEEEAAAAVAASETALTTTQGNRLEQAGSPSPTSSNGCCCCCAPLEADKTPSHNTPSDSGCQECSESDSSLAGDAALDETKVSGELDSTSQSTDSCIEADTPPPPPPPLECAQQSADEQVDTGAELELASEESRRAPATKSFPMRFKMFIDSAKVRFCCDNCGHGWTSMKGRVVFWYELFELIADDDDDDDERQQHWQVPPLCDNPIIGYCAYKLFGQQCDICKVENRFERPMWYPEEVTKVLGNLYNKIGQLYFGFRMPSIDRQRRAGKPKTSHNSSLCQACHDGVCTDRK